MTIQAGAGNAVLFFDPNNTNGITQADLVIFTDSNPSAATEIDSAR